MKEESLFHYVEVAFYIVTVSVLFWYLPLHISLFVLFPLVVKIWTRLTVGIVRSYRRIDGRTVIVTGANVGCGLETAKDLARRGGRVILACRNIQKGQAALEEIKREANSTNVVLKQLDLSSLASVRKFAKEIIAEEDRLDILINNAGTYLNDKSITADKLETCFQSNHFGPFLLTNLLLDKMKKTGNARIVMLSSDLHQVPQSLDLDNLNSEKSWQPFMTYCRTKVSNVLFTAELHRRLRNAGITELTVNSLHPGVVRTALVRDSKDIWYMQIITPIHSFFKKNVKEGAQTSIHVAISEEVDGVSGEFFQDCQVRSRSRLSKDSDLAKQLWERSAKAVGLKPEESIVY